MDRIAVLLMIALLTLAGCSPAAETDPEPASTEPALSTSAPASSDVLSGSWIGEWGPSERDRNDVTLQLQWDGTAITGTINPGPNAIPLTKGSYDPATMKIQMEAIATGRGGAKVHYMIEGTVEGTSMSGTWNHETRKGDFKLLKT